MPTWSPDLIRAAASSALMIFCARRELKIRFVGKVSVLDAIAAIREGLQPGNELNAPTVASLLTLVCELNHIRNGISLGVRLPSSGCPRWEYLRRCDIFDNSPRRWVRVSPV